VPINVRCYSNSDMIVRRSEVTLRAQQQTSNAITVSQHLYRRARKISPKRRRGLAFQPPM
jgi:hypothetical protein